MHQVDKSLLVYISNLKQKNAKGISFFEINDGKLMLVLHALKTALIIDNDVAKTRALLKGYLLTKNAGKLGMMANKIVLLLCHIVTYMPLNLVPKLNLNCQYQLFSWRQGMRYRFLDLNKKKIADYCFANEEEYLLKEINVRLEYADLLPMSKLIDFDTNGSYFVQEYTESKSVLSQISNKNLVNNCILSAFYNLEKLYKLTEKTVQIDEYKTTLENQIFSSNKMPAEIIVKMKNIKCQIDFSNVNSSLKIVTAHGDLNLGNILATSSDDIILIDWERIGPQSLTHDYYNFLWFLEYVHSADKELISKIKLSLNRLESISSFSAAENIAYEYVFFLERIFMWTTYSNSTLSWLLKLIEIMEKRSN
jgi:thiamine kinase-like enzyme